VSAATANADIDGATAPRDSADLAEERATAETAPAAAAAISGFDRLGEIGPLIVAGGAFVVYLRTLMPGIAFGDWAEMQTVPHIFGIAHPTGYPTYILLAWLTELIPIGSVALRANILSAVLVSAALAIATAISIRLGVRPLVAIAAGIATAAVGTIWAAATVAEVNPLHLFFAAAILHRALVWEARRRVVDLFIGGLLVGLSLGNHLLTVFIAPFIALFVLWAGRREIIARPWILLAAGVATLLGLSVYLYIPIAASRSPALPYNHPTTLDAVWWLVSGTQFRGQFDFLSADGPGRFIESLPTLWSLLVSRATPVLPILGFAGLAVLVWRRPAFGLMCAAILVLGLYVWANYLELEHYLLVPWLVLGIGAAVALDAIADGLWAGAARVGLGSMPGRDSSMGRSHAIAGLAVGAVGLVLALVLGLTNWRAADRSGDQSGSAYVATVMSALPQGAAILSEWDASTPLWHGQQVLGLRPDVLVVDDTNIVYDGWVTRERRIESLICERPVFMIRLRDSDLVPTAREFRVMPFLSVRVAFGGPSAVAERPVVRVEPLDPGACAGSG
jgi:hypothetical protein